MLRGLMMNDPLNLIDVLRFAAEVHGDAEIVSARVEGDLHHQTYRETWRRTAQLAHALVKLGITPGDRVATIAWNGHRHVELYYGISGIGAVCHTINPRLPAEQLTYIVGHAADRLMFIDTTFIPVVAPHMARFPAGLRFVLMTDRAHMPADGPLADALCYEDLLADEPTEFDWPVLDENSACALCYTSGTTGVPKGVLYSHRSCLLEALFAVVAFNGAIEGSARVLPVVPMFHVNAWGLPYCAPLNGWSLVMPGPRLDGASLFDLMESERVDASWGVPTVWLGLLAEMRKRGRKPAKLRLVGSGGSAAPRSMIEAFERDWGITFRQGWGMTETSPLGTQGYLSPREKALPLAQQIDLKTAGARRVFGVRMKIMDKDGREAARDGHATGELFVKGPIIAGSYYNNAEATAKAFRDGWFGTGDVATLTENGILKIVDRTKDLIKSGGEWISSIDLENAAAGCPGIAECAVIGVPHPKWDERPLLVAVAKAGEHPSKEQVMTRLGERFAKWQLPDDVVFVEQLPHTGTGKVSKLHLREAYADHYQHVAP